MLVTVLLRNGFTDLNQILYAYSVGLRIGYYIFSIPLSDKGCSLELEIIYKAKQYLPGQLVIL